MYSAPQLMMLYICVKFHQNIWNGFQLTERTRVHSRNGYFQYLLRFTGPQLQKQVNQSYVFLCSACCFMELFIWEKFHQNIWNCFQLTERTGVHGRNGYVQYSIGNNFKNRQTRVTVHVFCTSSHSALHMCEASLKKSQMVFNLKSGQKYMVFNLQSGHKYMVEMAMFNLQRAITSKVGKPELQFMCSARRLIVLYICVVKISPMVSELWSWHKWWKHWWTDG